jgi:hypothetical protein
MTRMWMLHPRVLCRDHLLGEHTEIHQVAGTLATHDHGESIVRGHAERGQVDTSRLSERHEALAAELERRGYTHDSPLAYDDELDLGTVDPAESIVDLRDRCTDCAARMVEGQQLCGDAPHGLEGETDEWNPEPAQLRDGETTDRSSHAQRNLEQIREGVEDGTLDEDVYEQAKRRSDDVG